MDIEDHLLHLKPGVSSLPRKILFVLCQDPAVRLRHFFSIPMWPASISLALLQITVLAYSATMITYLLQTGFSISIITVGRASGAITGLASTVITPWLVGMFRNHNLHGPSIDEDGEDDAAEGKVVRTVGLWGIIFQFLCLVSLVQKDVRVSLTLPRFRLYLFSGVCHQLFLQKCFPDRTMKPVFLPLRYSYQSYSSHFCPRLASGII